MIKGNHLKALNKFLKVSSVSKKDEESKATSSSSGLREMRGDNSIDNLEVKQMLYIDDFFFMLGHTATDPGQQEYLFMTKGNEIKDHFKLHTKTLVIRKVNIKEEKLIVSLGYDNIPEDDDIGGTTDIVDVLGILEIKFNSFRYFR